MNTLQMKDVYKIKRFTELSKGEDVFTAGSIFWIIVWLMLFFPALMIVIPWYILTRKGGTTIKTEHFDGSLHVYEKVSQPVMMALHKTVEF